MEVFNFSIFSFVMICQFCKFEEIWISRHKSADFLRKYMKISKEILSKAFQDCPMSDSPWKNSTFIYNFSRKLIFFNSKMNFNFKQFDCDFFNIYQWMETYHSLIPFSIFQCIFVIDFSKSKDLVILNFENWNSEK